MQQPIPENTDLAPPLAIKEEDEEDDDVEEEEEEEEEGTEWGEIEDDPPCKRGRKRFRRPVISDTVPAVPIAAFHRLVREIAADMGKEHIRWEARALEALQVDTEAFASEKFGKADAQRHMCKRRTVGRKHWRAVNC